MHKNAFIYKTYHVLFSSRKKGRFIAANLSMMIKFPCIYENECIHLEIYMMIKFIYMNMNVFIRISTNCLFRPYFCQDKHT